jgi:membrane protease YdiL (CAAX protease family)
VADDGPADPRDPDSLAPDDSPAPDPSSAVEWVPPPPPASPRARPGAATFTIEGRASPALFVIGWLASLLGLAIAIAGALGGSPLLVYFVGPGLLSIGLIAACGNQAFERRAHGAAYAGPSPFLVFGTIIAVSYFVGFVVGTLLDLVVGDTKVDAPVAQLLVGLITAIVFIGIVRLTVVGTGALSWADMQIRRFNRRALEDLAVGAVLAGPVVVATLILGAILLLIFPVEPASPLPPTGTLGGLLLQLIVGAIIAPVSEEIVFRGFALTAWERSIGPSRAIIRSSLLFALAHVISIEATSLPEAAGLIVVGMGSRLPVAFVLGWVFVSRRSIWASIGLHASFNAFLLILAHLAITAAGT